MLISTKRLVFAVLIRGFLSFLFFLTLSANVYTQPPAGAGGSVSAAPAMPDSDLLARAKDYIREHTKPAGPHDLGTGVLRIDNDTPQELLRPIIYFIAKRNASLIGAPGKIKICLTDLDTPRANAIAAALREYRNMFGAGLFLEFAGRIDEEGRLPIIEAIEGYPEEVNFGLYPTTDPNLARAVMRAVAHLPKCNVWLFKIKNRVAEAIAEAIAEADAAGVFVLRFLGDGLTNEGRNMLARAVIDARCKLAILFDKGTSTEQAKILTHAIGHARGPNHDLILYEDVEPEVVEAAARVIGDRDDPIISSFKLRLFATNSIPKRILMSLVEALGNAGPPIRVEIIIQDIADRDLEILINELTQYARFRPDHTLTINGRPINVAVAAMPAMQRPPFPSGPRTHDHDPSRRFPPESRGSRR
jgi:hypothetical protein